MVSHKNGLLTGYLLLLPAIYAQPSPKPSFGFVTVPQPSNVFARYSAIADIDRDGRADLVTADNAGLLVTFGNGDGTYRQPVRTVLNDLASAFTIADMDGDGLPDVIVYSTASGTSGESLSVFLGSGNGTFRFVSKLPMGNSIGIRTVAGANPIALGDFDRNGLLDIAVEGRQFFANAPTVDIVNVRLNLGNGVFADPVAYPTGAPSNFQLSPSFLIAGDFNGDGTPDLALATQLGSLSVLLGNGNGSFNAPLSSSLNADQASQITGFLAADLNGDGKLDLVMVDSWNLEPTFGGMHAYLGNGDGTFGAGAIYRASVVDIRGTEVDAGGMLVADLTGDGKLDVVTSNYRASGLGEIIVFPGNGDGTFQAASVYSTSAQPYQIAPADLNGDGRMDLLVTSQSTSTQLVSLLVLQGVAAPNLRMQITHSGVTYMDQVANFAETVVNLGDAVSRGQVTLNPGAGVTGIVDSQAGWTCAYVVTITTTQCTRSEPLAPGASYPAYPITMGQPDPNNLQDNPVLVATVSGGGSARTNGRDAASVVRLNSSCPFSLLSQTGNILIRKRTVIGRNGATVYLSLPGSGTFCPTTVQSDAAWLKVSSQPNVSFTVDPNLSGLTRTGALSFSSPTGWSDSITVEQSALACLYTVSPDSWTADYREAVYKFFVSVEDGCSWTAASSADWLSITNYTLGFDVQATANTSGKFRSATITAGGAVATVFQPTNGTPDRTGSMAHLAVGGGWDTTVQLVNASADLARTSLSTLTDAGSALILPALVVGSGLYTQIYYSLDQVLAPHAVFAVNVAQAGSALTTIGSAQLKFDTGVGGFVRFRYAPSGQEAIVPLETRNAPSYTFGFDNTNGIATGVAVASLVSVPDQVSISVTTRDDTGSPIGTSQFQLPPEGHNAFVLSDRFPETAGRSGTVEFSTATGGQISVLGIRFPPGSRFTTIPVAANSDPGSGIMPHLAVGGGWSTTVEVINTTASPAPARLKFFSPDGTPLTISMSVAGTPQTAAQVDQTLAPYGRLLIDITGSGSAAVQVGSAQLTSASGVSGFIRFRYAPREQEAIVPLQARAAVTYVLAFDHTDGIATGVALANGTTSAANIAATICDETGTQVGSGTVSIPANGQSAFVLGDRFAATANQRGTIEFTTPAGGSIGLLGIRFPLSGAFTTIPIISP